MRLHCQIITEISPPPKLTDWIPLAQSAYLLVPIGDGIFYSVLSIVHILHFFSDFRTEGPLNVGGP